MKNPTMTMEEKAAAKMLPTLKERLAVYEKLLHDLHFYTDISPDPRVVKALTAKISSWSRSCHFVSVTEDAVSINNQYANTHKNAVDDYIKSFWDMLKR